MKVGLGLLERGREEKGRGGGREGEGREKGL